MGSFFDVAKNFIGSPDSIMQNKWSADEAEKQREWAGVMSNTAHQREVNDLKAAGLNPILSAGGPGASSPTGVAANISGLAGSMANGINSALAIKRTKADVEKIATETGQSKLDLQMQKDMMELYRSDPKLRKQVLYQLLEKKTGSKIPDIGKWREFSQRVNSGFKSWTERFYNSWLKGLNERKIHEPSETTKEVRKGKSSRTKYIQAELEKKYPFMRKGMKQ